MSTIRVRLGEKITFTMSRGRWCLLMSSSAFFLASSLSGARLLWRYGYRLAVLDMVISGLALGLVMLIILYFTTEDIPPKLHG